MLLHYAFAQETLFTLVVDVPYVPKIVSSWLKVRRDRDEIAREHIHLSIVYHYMLEFFNKLLGWFSTSSLVAFKILLDGFS